MTENEIKEMLKDIIDNGAKYEGRFEGDRGDPPFNNNDWIPYNLGEEIHIDWGYRKVEKWCVIYNMNMNLEICNKSKHPNLKIFEFEGTKEECEEWIKKHQETWLEELNSKISPNAKTLDFKVKETATEVCKKILEEINKNKQRIGVCSDTLFYKDIILVDDIKIIIKDLGIDNV